MVVEIQIILTKPLSGTIYMEEALGLLSTQGGITIGILFQKIYFIVDTQIYILVNFQFHQ